ncbi:MAG: HAMP domain-containing protein [Deltaproteobacteria bacterium]|nr:MAG: HAMP domain-containing protein [Deltaproteobacteria bacterium]
MPTIIRMVKNFWNRSIQRQLMLGIALVHAILMTIFVADLVSRQKAFLHTQSLEQTEALARSLAANSVSWVLADDVMGLAEIVLSQKNYPNIEYAMILSPRGKVLAHTDNSLLGLYVQDPVSLRLVNGDPGIRRLVNDANLLDIAVPIFSAQQHIGWSRVAISQHALHSGLRKILRDGIGYTLLAIIVGSIFAVIMARGITTGIRQLLKVTRQVERGEIDTHVENERLDELGQLGDSFNKMIDRIRQSIDDLEKSQKFALEEKEKAERYLNTAMVSFLVLDKKGNVISVNPHCLLMLQYQDTEILGHNWFETCVPEQDRMEMQKRFTIRLQKQLLAELPFESTVLTKNNEICVVEWRDTHLFDQNRNVIGMLWSGIDITEKKANEAELEKYREHLEHLVKERTAELENALENIKTLKGIVPICSHCKKIRDDKGYWNQLEAYMAEHSGADFSHSICPECAKKHYPDMNLYDD